MSSTTTTARPAMSHVEVLDDPHPPRVGGEVGDGHEVDLAGHRDRPGQIGQEEQRPLEHPDEQHPVGMVPVDLRPPGGPPSRPGPRAPSTGTAADARVPRLRREGGPQQEQRPQAPPEAGQLGQCLGGLGAGGPPRGWPWGGHLLEERRLPLGEALVHPQVAGLDPVGEEAGGRPGDPQRVLVRGRRPGSSPKECQLGERASRPARPLWPAHRPSRSARAGPPTRRSPTHRRAGTDRPGGDGLGERFSPGGSSSRYHAAGSVSAAAALVRGGTSTTAVGRRRPAPALLPGPRRPAASGGSP